MRGILHRPVHYMIVVFRTAQCMGTMGQAVAAQHGIGHTCSRNSGAQDTVYPCGVSGCTETKTYGSALHSLFQTFVGSLF